MTTKTNSPKTIAPTLLAMLLCGVAPLTLGADYPERAAFGQRAAAVGLGVDAVNLLKRQPGPGAERTAAVVLERFHGRLPGVSTSDRFNREVTEKETTLVSEEGWYLSVHADGSSVRYRNYPYLEKTAHLARPVEKRFGPDELESLGRAFIAKHLDGLVKLGKHEDLVPYFSEFEISGGGHAQDGAPMDPELVQASTIVFTRVINGQPVLGGGSKIAVIFANDGEAIGFDYDWPTYVQTRSSQKILPLDQIRRRGLDYSEFNPDDAEVKERAFECGYIDLGARKRDPDAAIQAGCMRQAIKKTIVDPKAHADDQGSGHIVKSSLDFLPAGETIATDRVWELARKPVVDLSKITTE